MTNPGDKPELRHEQQAPQSHPVPPAPPHAAAPPPHPAMTPAAPVRRPEERHPPVQEQVAPRGFTGSNQRGQRGGEKREEPPHRDVPERFRHAHMVPDEMRERLRHHFRGLPEGPLFACGEGPEIDVFNSFNQMVLRLPPDVLPLMPGQCAQIR